MNMVWIGAMSDDDFSENYEPETPPSYDPAKLGVALRALTFLGDDPYLSVQVTNVAIVDDFLVQLETEALRAQIRDDRTPMDHLVFLSAQTQMWIFAIYELLRTWRQRATDALKLLETGGLEPKIDHLKSKTGPADFGSQVRAKQLEMLRDDPLAAGKLREDLRRVHMPFRTIEALRVSIAKHENAKQPNSIAYMPGYARLDYLTGSLKYELGTGAVIYDYVTRREMADSVRAILDGGVPSQEEIDRYEQAMKEIRNAPPVFPQEGDF